MQNKRQLNETNNDYPLVRSGVNFCNIYSCLCHSEDSVFPKSNISFYCKKDAANIIPINSKSMKFSWFVTYWTHPRWLFLIHLEKCCSIKALQVRTGACSAWCTYSYLAKLQYDTFIITIIIFVTMTPEICGISVNNSRQQNNNYYYYCFTDIIQVTLC